MLCKYCRLLSWLRDLFSVACLSVCASTGLLIFSIHEDLISLQISPVETEIRKCSSKNHPVGDRICEIHHHYCQKYRYFFCCAFWDNLLCPAHHHGPKKIKIWAVVVLGTLVIIGCTKMERRSIMPIVTAVRPVHPHSLTPAVHSTVTSNSNFGFKK